MSAIPSALRFFADVTAQFAVLLVAVFIAAAFFLAAGAARGQDFTYEGDDGQDGNFSLPGFPTPLGSKDHVDGDIILKGGNGGRGADIGDNGPGGGAAEGLSLILEGVDDDPASVSGSVTLQGGNGGNAAAVSGNGGDGGLARITIVDNVIVEGSVFLFSGKQGTPAGGGFPEGGNGGGASILLSGSTPVLEVKGQIEMLDDNGYPGAGNTAYITVFDSSAENISYNITSSGVSAQVNQSGSVGIVVAGGEGSFGGSAGNVTFDFSGGKLIAETSDVATGMVIITASGGTTYDEGSSSGYGKIKAAGITASSGGGDVLIEAGGSVMSWDANGGAGSGSVISTGAIVAKSLASANASVRATGGMADIYSDISWGGSGTLSAEGITVNAEGSGTATVSAVGTTYDNTIIFGRAEVDSGNGAINVISSNILSGTAVVEARGGGLTQDLMSAEVIANGISVLSKGAEARVVAQAGDGLGAGLGAETGGGSAIVNSKADITVSTSGSDPSAKGASVRAEGSGGSSGTAGGSGEVFSTGSISVSGGGTGEATVTATGGNTVDPDGGGGSGFVRADGITVTASSSGTVAVSAVATTHDGTGAISGKAKVDSGSGAITVTSSDNVLGTAIVEARGGGFTKDLMSAEVIANGIAVMSYGAEALVVAMAGEGLGAGEDAETGGGSARVHSNGVITVATGGSDPYAVMALVQAAGSGGGSGTAGGSGEVSSADGISVSGGGTGGAMVVAYGGDASNADGGGASVKTAGTLQLQADNGTAGVEVRGGRVFLGNDAGGAASVTADGVSVMGGTADAKVAFMMIQGGTALDGTGGTASLNSGESQAWKNVSVAAHLGDARVEIMAGKGEIGDKECDGAFLHAQNLAIDADGVGNAWLLLNGGGISGTGGNVSVQLEGSLRVSGANDAVGTSRLEASAVWLTDSTAVLNVKENLTVEGGDAGASSDGGSAWLTGFTSVVVEKGKLKVSSGEDEEGGSHDGGEAIFSTLTLKAREIDLAKSGSGMFAFSADALDVGDFDTTITANGTVGNDARFGEIIVSSDRRLSFFNENGTVSVGAVKVVSGKFLRLYVAESANLSLGELDVRGGTLETVLPAGFAGGGTAIVAKKAYVGGARLLVDFSQSAIAATDSFTLLHTTDEFINVGSGFDGNLGFFAESSMNSSVLYEISLEYDGENNILLKAAEPRANPRYKAVSESSAAGSAFLGQGSDLVVGEGVTGAVLAGQESGLHAFTAAAYGRSRYETGSHVTVNGFSGMVGVAFGADVSVGRVTAGAFAEYGNGSYESYNDFSAYQSVNGGGDMSYFGGGIVARLDMSGSESGHTYLEISGRAGQVTTEFQTQDFGRPYSFEKRASYYGIHLGVGRVINITDSLALDIYAKWIHTRQEGGDARVGGDLFRFGDVTSDRFRGGFRLSHAVGSWAKAYMGLAYDFETDGRSRVSVNGFSLDVPSLRGGTGTGELGLTLGSGEGLVLDMGVQAYAGVRRGISGSVRLTYAF
jgi:hypothetical protein